MKSFGEAQSKVMRAYTQSGQYHTIAGSRVHLTWYQSHALKLAMSIESSNVEQRTPFRTLFKGRYWMKVPANETLCSKWIIHTTVESRVRHESLCSKWSRVRHESLCSKWTISYHCGESCSSNMNSIVSFVYEERR